MTRSQVLAVAILGAWIMTTLCMWFAATRSFATVEHIMQEKQPEFVELTKPMGEASTLIAIRHTASEINRSLFWGYGAVQVGYGVILLLIVWRQNPKRLLDVGLIGTMLGLAVILSLVITPLVVSIGRGIDFLPRNPPPAVMPRFWMLHGAFTGLDGVKIVASIGLLARWIFRSNPART